MIRVAIYEMLEHPRLIVKGEFAEIICCCNNILLGLDLKGQGLSCVLCMECYRV